MTSFLACPTVEKLPFVPGTYKVEPPTEDAPAAYAAAMARYEGANAMLAALQGAGVRVPLNVHMATAAPLLAEFWDDARAVVDESLARLREDPLVNEARLIAERTA